MFALQKLIEARKKEVPKEVYLEPFEMYSPAFLDKLEEEVRSLPQKSPLLGRPVIDERLIRIMFADQVEGVDYDAVWAKDIVHYFQTLYRTWEDNGHLQFMVRIVFHFLFVSCIDVFNTSFVSDRGTEAASSNWTS
jgi:hypothetical protein